MNIYSGCTGIKAMLGLVSGNILPTALFLVVCQGLCVWEGLVGFFLSAVWYMLLRDYFNQILLNKFLAGDHYTGKTLHLPHFNSDRLL